MRETANLGMLVSGVLFCVATKVAASAMIVHSCFPLVVSDEMYTTVCTEYDPYNVLVMWMYKIYHIMCITLYFVDFAFLRC